MRLRPDVIFTTGTPGVTAAADATTAIPIIVGPAGEETLPRWPPQNPRSMATSTSPI